MEFSRQEYWNGLPFPSPGDFPHPGVKPMSPTLVSSFPQSHREAPIVALVVIKYATWFQRRVLQVPIQSCRAPKEYLLHPPDTFFLTLFSGLFTQPEKKTDDPQWLWWGQWQRPFLNTRMFQIQKKWGYLGIRVQRSIERDCHPKGTNTDSSVHVFLLETAEIKSFRCYFFSVYQRLHQIKTQEFKDPLQ